MSDVTLSQSLARFAISTNFEKLPEDVVASVKGRVLDTLGICLAATRLDTSLAAIDWVKSQGGIGQSTAIGIPHRVTAPQAAFVNGVLAHSLDYDDTHLPSVLHPSATIVPAALATAQATGATGRETIRAIAIGLETTVRIGMAGYDSEARSSIFFENGQHATSICGALGAAVASGLLLGLDESGLTNALGIASSMASGIIESNRTGGTVKRLHCGWAAQAGVSAAQLVQCGFTGPPTVLEGRFGFFQAWLHGNFDPQAITKGLGSQWSVPGIFFKPYPANHFTHGIIDAALEMRESGIGPQDLKSITVKVASSTVRTVGEPIDIKRAPETGYMAQFSAPYVIAAALTGGSGLGLGLDDFTDAKAQDPTLRQIMQKVSVESDPGCDLIFPDQFPAIVEAETIDGRSITIRVLSNRGGQQRPLSLEELGRKFSDNANRVLDPRSTTRFQELLARLDELPLIDPLLEPLGGIDAVEVSNK